MDNGVKRALGAVGQGQLLKFERELEPRRRSQLHAQIKALDLEDLARLIETHVRHKAPMALPKKIAPVEAYPRHPGAKHAKLYAQARARGEELLKAGKVGAFLVAGGQGTRLGYDGPKGEFPVTPIKNKPLFRVFAEQLLAHGRDAGRPIPWYIMTSDVNDAPTRAFFTRHSFFGYREDDVYFFQQGLMPAFAMDGKMLLADRDSLALSPDGHGGSLRALHRSGALADMRKRGVEHLSYFQVDNPLVYCVDPLFLGLHDITGSEMSSKTIPKAHPTEKVGNFVIGDGVLQVIEYSDLPDDLAHQTNPDGSLRFNAGSIAIHALRVSFIERLNEGGRLSLPWHRAEKKVPFLNDAGEVVKPQHPNAVKLEQFVFDAIPLAKDPIVYTTDRAEEFSPVKNAQGPDSPETSRRDQIRRAARWLKEAGVRVPMQERAGNGNNGGNHAGNGGAEPDCVLEISPLYAVTAEQLKMRNPKPREIAPGASVYYGS